MKVQSEKCKVKSSKCKVQVQSLSFCSTLNVQGSTLNDGLNLSGNGFRCKAELFIENLVRR